MKAKKPAVSKIVEAIARAAESKQAVDLKILDIKKSGSFADYLIVCGGESTPQLAAIKKAIERELKKNKLSGFKWEGVLSSGWLLLNLGGIVVHVMGEAERKFYNLEGLWGKDAIVYHY